MRLGYVIGATRPAPLVGVAPVVVRALAVDAAGPVEAIALARSLVDEAAPELRWCALRVLAVAGQPNEEEIRWLA